MESEQLLFRIAIAARTPATAAASGVVDTIGESHSSSTFPQPYADHSRASRMY
jgi:hypothetical protein